jgi:excinuclease ABC subunit C
MTRRDDDDDLNGSDAAEDSLPIPQGRATLEEDLEHLPTAPGVYLMKDADGRVVYVGKAINLRSRVRSYFREGGDSRYSVRFLRSRVTSVETVVVENEKEALLLENLYIKKYQPRYNIRLRDDKTYLSLRLDLSHEWPRVHPIRRRRPGDRALYFGPFSSSSAMKETLRFLQRLFPLRSCPDHVLNNRSRPCILHQIERCSAPCVGLVDKARYADYVAQTRLFLEGRRAEVLDLLRRRMWEYAEQMAYEKAGALRDRIRAIERTMEGEKVVSNRLFDRDIVGMVREAGRMLLIVMTFRRGALEGTESFLLRDAGLPDAEAMEGFLGQFYGGGRPVPRDVLLSHAPADAAMLARSLAEWRGGPVRIATPQRGEKARLVAMALDNARQELTRRAAGERNREEVLASLQRKLRLPRTPRRIECFDISNFQGSFNVGSMTCFIDGEPDKSQYRRFKIRTVEGQDDFSSMREILTRRYGRALREGSELPDLVVIDGGKGQLNIAVEVLRELGLADRLPVCGLAKARPGRGDEDDKSLRTEERVFLPLRKDPVRFDQSDPALFILTRLRDEAHRFGITFHRKLRSSASLRTGLEEVPGIGPTRRRQLLNHFGSLTRLRAATVEQLAEAPGMNPKLAASLYQFLHRATEDPAPEEPTPDWQEPDEET